MKKVQIVTDSVADIPEGLAQNLGIKVVPAYVQFGMRTYRDGVDIAPEEYYSRLMSEKELPRSSQPSPADFFGVFKQSLDSGAASVISLEPSSELSGTYQSACIARRLLHGATVDVVDTRTASMAQGLIAVEAARAALAGLSHAEILRLVRKLVGRVRLLVSLDTLDYIVRAGRIGRAKGLLASMLNIKPIITVANGIVEPLDRVRGAGKVIPRLVEICQDSIKGARVRASVIHAQALERALELKAEIERRLNTDVILSKAGPAVVTSAGPGAIGLAVMDLPDDYLAPGD